jgi:Mg2+ and Co2+ transporter CorA
MNILKRADEIVNHRSEEKERQYGEFGESMERTRDIFNAMTGMALETRHAYLFMVAHKLAREAHAHKEDNLLDACAYLGGLNNYAENQALRPPEEKNMQKK